MSSISVSSTKLARIVYMSLVQDTPTRSLSAQMPSRLPQRRHVACFTTSEVELRTHCLTPILYMLGQSTMSSTKRGLAVVASTGRIIGLSRTPLYTMGKLYVNHIQILVLKHLIETELEGGKCHFDHSFLQNIYNLRFISYFCTGLMPAIIANMYPRPPLQSGAY